MKPGTKLCTLGLAVSAAAIFLWHAAPRSNEAQTTADQPLGPTIHHLRKARHDPQADPTELLDRVRQALASADPADQAAVFSHLLADLVRADPQVAARFAETINHPGTRELVLHRVAQLWAEGDAGAALEWAGRLQASRERDALVTDVCLRVCEDDPAEAARALQRHIAGDHPHGGLEALAERWAERDFSTARDWALSQPAGSQRDRLIGRLAFHLAQDSPLEAATLVANEIPEGATQTEAVMTVLHRWAMRDPAAAAEWAGLFPEGELRTRAVHELEGIARSASELNR
jgi:hypothetical protein